MSLQERREKIGHYMEDNSMLILYSGIFIHVSEDRYFPFVANRQFVYLTDLTRENMALVMKKFHGKLSVSLYIEKPNPFNIRWTGKMVTPEEARTISGVEDIRFYENMEAELSGYMTLDAVQTVYFDTNRHSADDLPDYNLSKAQEFIQKYPAVTLKNIHTPIAQMRRIKDDTEIARIQDAIRITNLGLEQVLSTLRPGQKEYQVQAEFEYRIFYEGAQGVSFDTIAGSGANGTMLHYETNRDTCSDGDLILLDLGARKDEYCADITRTYPINGKFSPRQRQYYELVLKANQAVAEAAKPGLTTRDLNEICKKVLADGLLAMGKIEKAEEVGKYYMHGVSHQIGLDVHDVDIADGRELVPGCVISDEPGLYIDEEAIGIRIEDDLLITKDGCQVLSSAILKDPDEIEAFMAQNKK
jgi:Xaa-Pro aminopeptidase